MILFADLIRKSGQPRDDHGRWVASGAADIEEGKGQKAIARILAGEEHVAAAMHRPGIGDIDFRRGDGGSGILHILGKHGDAALRRMPRVLARGTISAPYLTGRGRSRLNVEHEGHVAILGTSDSRPNHWLITGFERRVGKSASGAFAPDPLTGDETTRRVLALDRSTGGAEAPGRNVGSEGSGVKAILFADLIRKEQPGAAAVHATTVLDGQRRRRRFNPDLSAFVKRSGKRELTPLDDKCSHVPFQYDPAAIAGLRPDQMPRFLAALTDSDKLPVETVDLDSLVAIQNRVDTAKVQAWADGSIKSDSLPVIVKDGSRDLIADGHHRLTGAWLRGDKTAKARVKDISPVSNAMKRASLDWSVPLDIRKADPDQRLVFGWASVIEKNGVIVTDKQGDQIPVSAMEPAAYDFVLNSRDMGHMHESTGHGRLVESMMFTVEKQQALGIDLGMVGWWTGFFVECPELWKAFRAGHRPEFSIGGSAFSREA